MLVPTLITASLIALASAQEPPFLSPVLVQPGLTSLGCIQPQNGASADGTPIVLATCTGSTAQEFFFSNSTIRVFSNKCLAVPSVGNGVQLQLKTCNSADPNQQWYYNFFNHNQISLLNKGQCIDLTDGSISTGNKIQTWSCSTGNPNQVWNTGYLPDSLPITSESGQFGINNCGTTSSQSSKCQTIWFNDVDDFCLWAPPSVGTIGDTEREEVAWCTKAGRGTRTIPNGMLQGVHFVKTPSYVQVTGVGDLTKINIPKSDGGGELDAHGADGRENPIGGLIFGNTFAPGLQYHEWTSFIGNGEFCFRACTGKNAAELCNHIYDELGCMWNIPANYDSGVFESCEGDEDLPMGVYGSSTFHQGQASTPPAHPAASSSNCRRLSTVSVGTASISGVQTTSTSTPPTSTSHSSSTTTTTTSSAPTGTNHVIHPHVSATKCLNAASNADGAHVTIQDCNGSSSQAWQLVGNTLRVFGNKCLDVTNGVDAKGTLLQVWTCTTNDANQNWTAALGKAGAITWTGKAKCLDLTNGVSTNGQQMQIWQCSGDNNQIWTIE